MKVLLPTEGKLLSGVGQAHFEVFVHVETLENRFRGSRVQG
jgi:hypothetical protein